MNGTNNANNANDANDANDADNASVADAADVAEAGGKAASPAYDATRRTPRKHRRVVFHGTENFDADGVKLEPGDMVTERQREADDDKRILGELPPHWAVFNERR